MLGEIIFSIQCIGNKWLEIWSPHNYLKICLSKEIANPQREGRLCPAFIIHENFKPKFRHKLSLTSNGRIFLIIKPRNLEPEVLEHLHSSIANSYDLRSPLGLIHSQQRVSPMPLDFHKLSTSNVNINQYLQKVLKHQIVLFRVHLTTGFWVREANLLLSLHFHLFSNISALSKVENTGLAGLDGKRRKLLSYKINRSGFF